MPAAAPRFLVLCISAPSPWLLPGQPPPAADRSDLEGNRSPVSYSAQAHAHKLMASDMMELDNESCVTKKASLSWILKVMKRWTIYETLSLTKP